MDNIIIYVREIVSFEFERRMEDLSNVFVMWDLNKCIGIYIRNNLGEESLKFMFNI